MLDLASQGTHINNQTAIYALQPQARSRLTTAYLVASFSGMVLGSTLAAVVYDAGGWYEVCAVAAGFSIAALVIWIATQRVGAGRAAVPARSTQLPVEPSSRPRSRAPLGISSGLPRSGKGTSTRSKSRGAIVGSKISRASSRTLPTW